MYLFISVVLFAVGLFNVGLGVGSIVLLHSGAGTLSSALFGEESSEAFAAFMSSLIWVNVFFTGITSLPIFACSLLARAIHRMRSGYL